MSSDNDQFYFPFGDSGTEISERSSVAFRKPNVRNAKNQAVRAEPDPASLPAATACSHEGNPKQRFLSVGDVALRYSVSVPTIWRWQKTGTFPRCYQIGTGTSRWALTELEAYDHQLLQGSKR